MGLQRALNSLALGDRPSDDTQFMFGGTDLISVVAFNADAALEIHDGRRWLDGASEAIRIRRGLHKPVGGLATAYPPRGVHGFRFRNWTPGAIAQIDFEAYSVGG
jgi:hypothetical protein